MPGNVSVTLTALTGAEASEHVSRFLALIFEGETPASVRPRLEALPLLITDEADRETAALIQRHLKARGGEVELEGEMGEAAEAPERAVPPARPSPRAAEGPATLSPLNAPAETRERISSPAMRQHRAGAAAPAVPDPPPWEQPASPGEEPKKKKGLFGGLLGR